MLPSRDVALSLCSGGKTQLCMQLACNVQIPKRLQGAWEGEAIYIGETSAHALCMAFAQLIRLTASARVRSP